MSHRDPSPSAGRPVPSARRGRPKGVSRAARDEARKLGIAVSLVRICPLTAARLREIARTALAAENVSAATVSIAVVSGKTMRRLNRTHLNHDFDTDVLSFLFESASASRGRGRSIDGEVILSVDMARRVAPQVGSSVADELSLYLVHGLLHLCGYDDLSQSDRRAMKSRESAILKLLGIADIANSKPAIKNGRKRDVS